MDPVSNTDRLVRLLRQKLEERAKTKGPSKAAQTGPVRRREPEATREIMSDLARAGVDDQHFRRSLVEQLLADQFGPALINEPKFQIIVDQVAETMAADPGIGPLLSQTLADLRVRAA